MAIPESNWQLSINAPGIPIATFKRAIHDAAEENRWVANGVLILEPTHRGVDPTIQVALVQMGSTALGALLTGVFAVVNARMSSKVIIVGKTGERTELPGKPSVAEIERCMRILNSDPPKHIEIVHD